MAEQITTLEQLQDFRKSDLGKDILTQAYDDGYTQYGPI